MKAAIRAVALVGILAAESATAGDNWPGTTVRGKDEANRGTRPVRDRPLRSAQRMAPPALADLSEVGDRRPGPSAPSGGTASQPIQPAPAWQWRILRTEWSEADERGFEAFVGGIGRSDCKTMQACLTSAEANPEFYATNPPGMTFYADCADLPYLLRSYYAWKRGLPFSFASAMRSLGSPGDIRYNLSGNRVAARKDLVSTSLDARQVIPEITGLATTAQFRTRLKNDSTLLADHYPVGISPASIKPGTIIYDAYGHIAVVYEVTPEGRVLFMDSHPDNSLTRGLYGRAFHRQSPAIGGGFKRWRPLKLVGASRRADGSYTGGRIELSSDRQLADWSDEQYYGTETPRPQMWREARFRFNGRDIDYYHFVRLRLARPGFRYDPVEETRTMLRNLCRDIHYRRDAVDIAIRAGLHRRSQPARLPYNIYGTDGDWEIFSTPSRDARLRTGFKELRDEMARFLELDARNSDEVRYAGEDLRADLRRVYHTEAEACPVTYTRSNGAAQTLGFHEVVARLFDLSFDPYHCPERRWGATEAAELVRCPDNRVKRAWYEAERRLRNQIDRVYEARMDFTLRQLARRPPGSGVDAPPDIDVHKLIGTD